MVKSLFILHNQPKGENVLDRIYGIIEFKDKILKVEKKWQFDFLKSFLTERGTVR